MDRRTLLAILLFVAFYYVWLQWVAGNQVPEPVAEPARTGVERAPEAAPSVTAPRPELPDVPPDEALPPPRELPWEACGMRGEWTTRDGTLRDVRLPDHQDPFVVEPLWRWVVRGMPGKWKPYGDEPGPAHVVTPRGRALTASVGSLGNDVAPVAVLEESPSRVVLRGRTADGVEITRTVSAPEVEGRCVVSVEVTWRNVSAEPWTGDLWVGVHDDMDPDAGRYSSATRPVAHVGEQYETLYRIDRLTAPDPREGRVRWFGVADRYFAFVLLSDRASPGVLWYTTRASGTAVGYGAQYVVPARTLASGEVHVERFRLFAGPKEMGVLRAVDPTLTELVELGFFGFFARILLWLLEAFHRMVGNWGWSIVLLTVLVKALFFPLTQMSFKSSQAMSALQPELTRLREELKDNQEELNRRMFALFKENGVNPLGGCLPMLVQMPIWFALYSVLLSSVALYHTEFLYLRDLSEVDPYLVLPTVTVALMVVQQQMMPMGNLDPAQARMMKLMPLIFGVFFFTFPSGLVLYIFVNMVLTILQQWYIRRTFTAAVPATANTEGGR